MPSLGRRGFLGYAADNAQYPAMTLPYLKADKQADFEYRRDVAYTPPCE